MKAFKYLKYQKGDLPVSELLSSTIISLPMHPYLKKEDIHLVLEVIKNKS